jgi:hypothetical protein
MNSSRCGCRRLLAVQLQSSRRCTESLCCGGAETDPFSSSSVRKSIARVLTVMNQKARQAQREQFKGKKYKPLDLRPKKTRAIRRRLTPVSCISVRFLYVTCANAVSHQHEASLKTLKQSKKNAHFPARKYAVKA